MKDEHARTSATLVSQSVVTDDGRTICFVDGGDPDGFPVIGLHGTRGCRLSRWPDDSLYADAGIRYITSDRAGYRRSTRHRDRRVADEASDVRTVADVLGLDLFSIVGGSGGGPHALACAALLGDRVVRVACQSSLAPLGPDGLTRKQWLHGMDPEIAAELGWADAGEEVLTVEMERAQRLMEERIYDNPGAMLGQEANATDVGFLERPETIEAFSLIIPEQARHGVSGSVDDTLAFVRPWGFDLRTIRVPVLITFGDEDTSCPAAHGRFLAASVRGAVVIETKGGGHFAADPTNEIREIHLWLSTGELPGPRAP